MALTKTCIICGAEFTTHLPYKTCCSAICIRKREIKYAKEYRKKHPKPKAKKEHKPACVVLRERARKEIECAFCDECRYISIPKPTKQVGRYPLRWGNANGQI